MTAHDRAAARVRRCDPQVILRAAALCDGHSILTPEALLEAGLPADFVRHLTATHRSDGTPKGTLFVQGQAVAELRGVYGLHALRFLAGALGLEYRRALGRGSEANNIRRALRSRLAPAAAAATPPSTTE